MKRYSNYKESGIEWIGEIPVYWGVMQLGFIADIQNGYAFSSDDFDFNFAVPVIRIGDIKEVIDLKHATKVKKETYDKTTEFSARKNDILIAMTGATIGKSTEYLTNDLALINQRVGAIRARNIVNKRFLTYLINSSIFRLNIEFECYGGAQENISKDQLNRFKFPLPPLPEQQLITNFLDRKTSQIDDLIKKKEELVRLLELKRQAVINEAVTKGLNPKAKMKDSGVDWIGEVPEMWEVKKLKYYGEAIIGMTYSPDDIVDENQNGSLVLRSSNIQNGLLALNDNVYISKPIPEKLKLRLGDILLCSRNGSRNLIGKNICITEKMVDSTFGAFMTVFRSKYFNYISKYFNSQVFTSQSSLFLSSTINQLTTETLNNLIIAIPKSIEEQNKIVNYLNNRESEILTIVSKIRSQIEMLGKFKSSLIYEVVTGKVNVSNENNTMLIEK